MVPTGDLVRRRAKMASITMADLRAAVPDMTGEVAIKGLAGPVSR